MFDFGGGLGPELAPSQTRPDVMSHAWRDHGNRAGAFRLHVLFDRLDLRTTALINADVLDRCPGLAEACRDRGDEIAAHGAGNAAAQGSMFRPTERAMIADATERLAEAGYRYLLDCAHDDQPVRFVTARGALLSVPYSQEANDLPAVIGRRQEAATFAAMIRDAVAQLLSGCDRRPSVSGIVPHPYIMGQAHRVPPLARVPDELRQADDPRIWWTTAGGIAGHVEANARAV